MISTSGQSFRLIPFLVFVNLFSVTFSVRNVFSDRSPVNDDPFIELENGLIQGKVEKILGHDVKSYLGIPYAEPPVGEGRFRKAKPFRSQFNGVYNATYFRSACQQKVGDEAFENLGGVWFSEDCLHLNIWVPNSVSFSRNEPRKLKSVVFYIFASAFAKSSPARFHHRGEYLSAFGDIIIVTPNYRLGFLSFACCGQDDDDMPGNLGLHDLILALKWTRENIRKFGGDPEAITLSGASAGAISSIMLIHSTAIPDSWINNIFIMSGAPANEVTIDSFETGLAKTRYITEKVSCSKIDSQSIKNIQPLNKEEIDCLRTSANLTAILQLQDAEEVVLIGGSIKNGIIPIYGDKLLPSSPEPILGSNSKFHHRHSLKSFVIGVVENEGSWITDYWAFNKTEAYQYLIPKLRSMLKTNSSEILSTINSTIDSYFDSVDEDDIQMVNSAMHQLYSDWVFRCPSLSYGLQYARNSNLVHLYLFDYVPRSYVRPDGINERPFGATHGDDTRLVFGHPFRDSFLYDNHDRLVSSQMMKIFSDFVKDRRLPWPPVLTNKFNKIEPLRWRINGHLNERKDIDIFHSTGRCDRLNKLRNYKMYESVDGMDNQV